MCHTLCSRSLMIFLCLFSYKVTWVVECPIMMGVSHNASQKKKKFKKNHACFSPFSASYLVKDFLFLEWHTVEKHIQTITPLVLPVYIFPTLKHSISKGNVIRHALVEHTQSWNIWMYIVSSQGCSPQNKLLNVYNYNYSGRFIIDNKWTIVGSQNGCVNITPYINLQLLMQNAILSDLPSSLQNSINLQLIASICNMFWCAFIITINLLLVLDYTFSSMSTHLWPSRFYIYCMRYFSPWHLYCLQYFSPWR